MMQLFKQRPVFSIPILTFLVFVSFFCIGLTLAQNKPLWNDELYTQIHSVERFTVWETIRGDLEEGNSTPLFYLIQKGFCWFAQYKIPFKWTGAAYVNEPYGQIILRLNPIFFTSFMVALIFYFFARYYSLGCGLYSLLISLGCFIFWTYWAEARQYAQWMFFTTAHTLLLLRYIQTEKGGRGCWKGIALVHFALSVTVVFGLVQVLIATFFMFICGERDWRHYVVLTIIPISICVFYYFHTSPFYFWFTSPPISMIYANIPQEWLVLIIVYVFYICIHTFQTLKGKRQGIRACIKSIWQERSFIYVSLLVIMAGFALLGYFKLIEVTDRGRFAVVWRYFVFLAPVGVITVVLISIDLMRSFQKYKWIQLNIIIVLGGTLLLRLIKTFYDIYALALYIT